jgi:stage II sporulation protein D
MVRFITWRHGRFTVLLLSLLLPALFMLPSGCMQDRASAPLAANSPRLIRVLVADDAERAQIAADDSAITLDSRPVGGLQFSGGAVVWLSGDGWHVGRQVIRSGVLTLTPPQIGFVRVNGTSYRGDVRLVPVGGGRFDVINDIDVEDYLAGVVTKEMFDSWPLEAIKAQAVAARTYVLYVSRTGPKNRGWDVYGDERSQMYGGLTGETAKSRAAVAQTQGIVLTYGPGNGTIFKAYFSSCCGGVTQAASDAFPGDPYIPPLAEQSHGATCNGSKYFNWGPIVLSKAEISRRIHQWAIQHSQETGRAIAELNMAAVYRIDVQQVNRYGRPNRVLITDAHGVKFSWPAEQLRTAVNTDPRGGATLPSSYCKISSEGGSITFYEGHGFGHGVGLCQWCAEARAAAGENFAQILVDAYPQAKLVRAY